MNASIRVQSGLYQVGRTTDGRDFVAVGQPFDKPRLAIRFATSLDRGIPYVSPLRERSSDGPDSGKFPAWMGGKPGSSRARSLALGGG